MEVVIENRPNPLVLPEMLEKMFGYLPFADLKACRLVNWTWTYVTNHIIKTKYWRVVGFSNVDNEHRRLRRYKFYPICDKHKFLKCVEGTKEKREFPITRLLVHITFDRIDAEILQAVAPFVEELWIQLSVTTECLLQSESPLFQRNDYPVLKKLRVFYVDCPHVRTIESRFGDDYKSEDCWDDFANDEYWYGLDISEIPWYAFPNLPKIKQRKKQNHGHKLDTKGHGQFLATLLSSTPTLESFSVTRDFDNRYEYHIQPSTTVILHKKCFITTMQGLFWNKLRSLTEFESVLPYDNKSLMRLSNLKVSTLKIGVNRTTVDMTTFRNFLQSQSESLKSLTITNEVWREPWPWYAETDKEEFYIDFPEMTALQSLTLRETDWGQRMKYGNISYHKQFPALKQITFLFTNDTVNNFYHATDSSDTVTDLRVKVLKNERETEKKNYYSYRTHAVFPNLRKLEIEAESSTMNHVYKNLPLLEHLTLYGVLIPPVFGLRSHWCVSCSDYFDEPCPNDRCKEDGKPSISSLSRLKTLQLYSSTCSMSDSVCREIMNCPSLERLIIATAIYIESDNFGNPRRLQVSDRMLNKMRTKFKVDTMKPNDND